MKKRAGRITAAAVTAIVTVSSILSASVLADAWNPAGGCKINAQIKKANPANVVKDGIIGDGEYAEIKIDRNSETTDCLLSWVGGKPELMESAEKLLQNVHFYISWDETHGLNLAAQATLIETPVNPSPLPTNDYYENETFPGDEFLFQFGALFATYTPTGKLDKNGIPDLSTTLYRGISKNTETGELLIGHYGAHGLTGSIDLTAGQDYNVAINGNTVTYEISYPFASVIEGGNVTDGTELYFTISTTGGSQGKMESQSKPVDTACYAVSLGDTGYMSARNAGEKLRPAIGTFSSEAIPGGSTIGGTTGGTTGGSTDGVTGGSTGGTSGGAVGGITDGSSGGGAAGGISGSTAGANPSNPSGSSSVGSTTAPSTGDAAVILAAASAFSACGAKIVCKKRK